MNVGAYRLGLRFQGIEIVVWDVLLPLLTLYILVTQPLYKRRALYW